MRIKRRLGQWKQTRLESKLSGSGSNLTPHWFCSPGPFTLTPGVWSQTWVWILALHSYKYYGLMQFPKAAFSHLLNVSNKSYLTRLLMKFMGMFIAKCLQHWCPQYIVIAFLFHSASTFVNLAIKQIPLFFCSGSTKIYNFIHYKLFTPPKSIQSIKGTRCTKKNVMVTHNRYFQSKLIIHWCGGKYRS